MSSNDMPNQRPVAVVFGGRSPIAIACGLRIARQQDVVLVTRSIDEELREAVSAGAPRLTLVAADLASSGTGTEIINEIYASGREVNAAVFLQRYRPEGPARFDDHAAIELWSIEETLMAIRQQKTPVSEVQAIVSSSPAAHKVLNDQGSAYHVVKAGQEALVRFLAATLLDSRIFVNGIRIGSIVMKPRAAAYWKSIPDVVSGLQRSSPSGSLQTSEDVGWAFARLAMAGLAGATGQFITLDDGFDLRDGVQMAKAALEHGGTIG
jgi:NAD(P)-dependent dehydrogenase (short-subunit alcohol dehydrogenase family)